MKAQWAVPIALATAIVVATAVYGMPVGQAVLSAAEGATFGLFPIMWIVVAAIWVYNMTVETGHFAVLRRSIGSVSEDRRIQAVLIAFCFGTLLEALAGFGAPAAITAVMMVALGFKPIKAAALALLGNTAAVPFGALAIPIMTLSDVTGLDEGELGAMVGRQTPLLALIVPFILVGHGRRPARAQAGVARRARRWTRVRRWLSSRARTHISVELTDIVASISSLAAIVALLRVWAPAEPLVAEPARRRHHGQGLTLEVLRAYAPYLVILAVFSTAQLPAVKRALAGSAVDGELPMAGSRRPNSDGAALPSLTFRFDWLPCAGTLMLISGLITMAVIGLAPGRALRVARATLVQLRGATLVVTAVLALAYVVNQSGQTLTLGLWAAGAGSFFAFLAPVIGWLGVAVTGSDTASNALFGGVQVAAADHTGIPPTLLAAANASGGVLGKMISAQHLAIAAAAVGMAGHEGALFRKVVGWSIVLLLSSARSSTCSRRRLLDWMVAR